jgi:hypothetical protein
MSDPDGEPHRSFRSTNYTHIQHPYPLYPEFGKGLWSRTVDVKPVVTNNLLYEALLLKLDEPVVHFGSVDLQASADEDGGGDHTVGRNVRVAAFLAGLVHEL